MQQRENCQHHGNTVNTNTCTNTCTAVRCRDGFEQASVANESEGNEGGRGEQEGGEGGKVSSSLPPSLCLLCCKVSCWECRRRAVQSACLALTSGQDNIASRCQVSAF